jgi:hypothetical protein
MHPAEQEERDPRSSGEESNKKDNRPLHGQHGRGMPRSQAITCCVRIRLHADLRPGGREVKDRLVRRQEKGGAVCRGGLEIEGKRRVLLAVPAAVLEGGRFIRMTVHPVRTVTFGKRRLDQISAAIAEVPSCSPKDLPDAKREHAKHKGNFVAAGSGLHVAR